MTRAIMLEVRLSETGVSANSEMLLIVKATTTGGTFACVGKEKVNSRK